MSDYRVLVRRSPKRLRQRFYVSIVAANGETLFHSEQLRDRDYARELATRIAGKLDANLIDAS